MTTPQLRLPFKSTFWQGDFIPMQNDSSSKWTIPKRVPPPCAGSIIELIGGTPMVELKRLVQQRGLRGKLFAKLEYLNPGFSQNDRIALEIVQSAKASGLLQPGQTVIELTSGNTGAGLVNDAMLRRALLRLLADVDISLGNQF